MKNTKNFKFAFLSVFLAMFFVSCNYISVEIIAPDGGVLEDAILIVSDNGAEPRKAYVLGDIDLSGTTFTFSHTVDTLTYTHWWLIGSMSGDVVFSSVLPLTGADMYTIEPYSGSESAWNIPNNLNAYASGTTYSLDWWGQTVSNHSSHVAANKAGNTLWKFNEGSYLGTIAVDLKK